MLYPRSIPSKPNSTEMPYAELVEDLVMAVREEVARLDTRVSARPVIGIDFDESLRPGDVGCSRGRISSRHRSLGAVEETLLQLGELLLTKHVLVLLVRDFGANLVVLASMDIRLVLIVCKGSRRLFGDSLPPPLFSSQPAPLLDLHSIRLGKLGVFER